MFVVARAGLVFERKLQNYRINTTMPEMFYWNFSKPFCRFLFLKKQNERAIFLDYVFGYNNYGHWFNNKEIFVLIIIFSSRLFFPKKINLFKKRLMISHFFFITFLILFFKLRIPCAFLFTRGKLYLELFN